MIEVEILRSCVDYDPDTGAMTFKAIPAEILQPRVRSSVTRARLRNTICAGKPAFASPSGNGYLKGLFLGKRYYAHRVAWAITYGAWPKIIDHINGNRSDNRIVNLRSVDSVDNSRNSSRPITNSSGVVGVRWSKPCGKWSARIMVNKSEKHLGVFEKFEDAVAARKRAEQAFGYHQNHGRVPAGCFVAAVIKRDPAAMKILGRVE